MQTELIDLIISSNRDNKRIQLEGQEYYKSKNTEIMKREKTFYSVAHRKEIRDCTKANNRLASGFTKIVIDQKINYLINADATISGIDEYIDINSFTKMLYRVSKNASNSIYGVIQWYVKDSKLKYKIIPSEQIIVEFSEDNKDEIKRVYRHYLLDRKELFEIWDDKKMQRYVKIEGEWELLDESSHVTQIDSVNNEVIDMSQLSWGRVPFSFLFNNDELTNDLQSFKSFVDLYDITMSDLGNNLEDFQEMYWILKNYDGQDAESFIREYKKSRVLRVGDGGDAKQVAQEVPYQARKTTIELLRNDIFEFGMAVDIKNLSGGNITNQVLEGMFSNLDLKTNAFELEVIDFFNDCLYFIKTFYKVTLEDASISFSRAMIINRKENIETVLMQKGLRADEKLLEQIPSVDNVEEEIELLKKQEAEEVKSLLDV